MRKSTKQLLVFTITSMVVMSILDIPLKNEIAPNGIISFELAQNLDNSIAILNSWSGKAKLYAGLSLGFDYLFMLSYSLLLFELVKYISSKIQNRTIINIGNYLAYFMILAGIFDAIENYALIKLYLGNFKQVYSSIAYYFATFKFIFIVLGIIYIILGVIKIRLEKNYSYK